MPEGRGKETVDRTERDVWANGEDVGLPVLVGIHRPKDLTSGHSFRLIYDLVPPR